MAESRTGSQVDQLVSVFIDACRQGRRPSVEAYLPADPALRWPALVELVRAELEWRLRSREAVRVEEYLERYPELERDTQEVLALLAAEYIFRRQHEPQLQTDEYCQRFPQFADELPLYLESATQLRAESVPTHPERSTYGTVPSPAPGDNRQPVSALGRSEMLGYEIQTELGRGGMGIVYRAYDPRRQQVVALKTLQWMDPSNLYRFKQEFRTLADVTHPNLVSLYELISDGREWFFTMELVEGVDFQTYVRGGQQPVGHPQGLSPVQLDRLRSALRQLALGIEALHEAGKLHRDIKHRNVLVTPAGRVVVLDFGVSADLGQSGLHHSTQPHLLGTVTYMSPEQAAARPVSTATDWYSVGVMLYEVLTGRLPFSGRPLDILQQKQTTDPSPPATLVAQIPNDLDQLCVDLLQRDPQARPTARQVLERLGGVASHEHWASSAVQAALPPSTFIGRVKELATLEEAYATMLRGQPVTAFVHGSSGSGKSALVQAFLEAAETRGAVILLGRCYEQESVPYKAIDSLIDSLSKYLARLPLEEARELLPRGVSALLRVFPVLGRADAIAGASGRSSETPDPQELRRKAFGALRELLARIGDRSPLVLFIDDLQWGDLDSAGLVAELLRPPDAPALLLIGCYRSDDARTSPFLVALSAARRRTSPSDYCEISLEPMPLEDSLRLAKSLLEGEGIQANEHAMLAAKESGGNPFFIYELVQHLKARVAIDRGAKPQGEFVLEQVLRNRIAALPEHARDLLEVIAVAGRPLRLEEAFRAAGLDHDQRTQVAALRTGRLVRGGSGAFGLDAIESYHDRIRQTIINSLPPLKLRERHRCLAEAFESSGDSDPEAMAMHFEQAGESAQAAKYYAVAADQARNSLAFDRAATLYRRVLALRQYVDRDAQELQIQLADALANAGRGADAAREYCEAAQSVDENQSLELQQRAALQYLISGRYAEGAAILRKVSKAVGMHFPPT
ncbi:MAG: protein kinase, partial [Planctomycetia bacterium]|nr:protein kinase [Planctomycetia bacterium]